MKVSLYKLENNSLHLNAVSEEANRTEVNLVLCFAAKNLLYLDIYDRLHAEFPIADIVMCSTSGEIFHDTVLDNSAIIAAMQFRKTKTEVRSVNLKEYPNTYSASISLAKKLPTDKLNHVLIFSDGSLVNGSELVKGLTSQIDKKVLITGGLAGDAADFKSTLVGLNKKPVEGEIVAIGLYGNDIKVTHGSQGGWDTFGLEKRVTNSAGNVLMELEDQNALELYKKYLGDEAKNLPASALLFPLSVLVPGAKKPVVRTILSVNEDDKSMTFAGDVPVGSVVRFMKANFDKLTMAAAEAATFTHVHELKKPDFSLLISCVGRKLILGPKIDQEVKAVSQSFDNKTPMLGFYSYGEISPFNEGGYCQLHNQTMTITSFYEN